MSDRFEDIPETAKRDSGTTFTIPFDNPFVDCEITNTSYEGIRVIRWVGPWSIDLTDAYNKWVETLPKIHYVKFEWTEPGKDSNG